MKNQRGSILVFVTLIVVLLLIMIGMGLDTGHLVYIRAQGQAAVDAAALAAASGIPTGNDSEVVARASGFNAKNDYLSSPVNAINGVNVTYVRYDDASGGITTAGVTIANANGVRVALEERNPYTAVTSATAVNSPLFLTPLFNLFGQTVNNTQNVSVSAVAVLKASPGLPIAIEEGRCGEANPQKLIQTSAKNDNSGYTTYYIENASASEIKALLKSAETCGPGIPAVGIGYCTQLNEGVITSVYSDFEAVFKARPGKCFMLPVVKNGARWNQCNDIKDMAKFCPDATTPVVQDGKDKYLLGDISCGANPYKTSNVTCYVPTLVRDVKSGM
jgi:Flp pilus assembly protein TadG